VEHIVVSDFNTAAILTLALPIGMLVLVGLFWWFVLRKSDLGDELERDPSA
jgi:ribose/xylose/arabinose/galactoside ABC-type transport system permease subunit